MSLSVLTKKRIHAHQFPSSNEEAWAFGHLLQPLLTGASAATVVSVSLVNTTSTLLCLVSNLIFHESFLELRGIVSTGKNGEQKHIL